MKLIFEENPFTFYVKSIRCIHKDNHLMMKGKYLEVPTSTLNEIHYARRILLGSESSRGTRNVSSGCKHLFTRGKTVKQCMT